MSHITSVVVVLKTLTLVLGFTITYLAYKAWDRTGSKALWSLTIGFGLITLGAILAGAIDQAIGLDRTLALAVESALNAAGFAVIVYSLYVDR